jgi:hypothetical protein
MIYGYLLLGFLLMVGPHVLSPQLEDVAQTLAQTPAAESSNGNRTTGPVSYTTSSAVFWLRFGSVRSLANYPNALGV